MQQQPTALARLSCNSNDVTLPLDLLGLIEYSFSWVVPNVEGTYIVEVSLVLAQLTAYDAKWLEANELPTELGYSSAHSLVVSKSLVNGVYALFMVVGGQALSGGYSVVLPKYKGKKLRTFSRAP